MKKIKLQVLLLFTIGNYLFAQGQSNLKVFEALMNSTWRAEAKWGDGSKFKQEVDFKYSLDSTLVIASSLGYVNKEQTKFGARNHGIRKFDAKTGKLLFWEYDVFGGVTKGNVTIKENNIYYTYDYGGTEVTDAWLKIDENNYQFIVGVFKDGKWKNKFLDTQFKKVDKKTELIEILNKVDAAVVSRDYKTLDMHFSDNLKFVAPNGIIASKDMILTPFKNPNSKSNLNAMESDYKEVIFSGNNAYVISETTHKFTQGKDLKYKQIIVLKNSNGVWQMEFVQSTLVNN